MSQPEDTTKLGYFGQQSSISSRVAFRMDSGVPFRNSPAGSIFPITTLSRGIRGSISCMEMAFPK